MNDMKQLCEEINATEDLESALKDEIEGTFLGRPATSLMAAVQGQSYDEMVRDVAKELRQKCRLSAAEDTIPQILPLSTEPPKQYRE